MLKFSMTRVCAARGIAKPYSFMVKNGFSPTAASKLAKGDVEYIKLEYLETLSALLNCTPNDLLVWAPNRKSDDKADHPLQQIRQNGSLDLTETLRSLSMDKLKEIELALKNMS